METAALVSAIAGFVAASAYLFVGWRLSRRQVSPEVRFPAVQFVLFWGALAGLTALGGLESLVAAFSTPSLPVALTFANVNLLLACAALWGLVGYLVYLYTGRSFTVPLAALYGALYVLATYYLTASVPDGVTVTAGTVAVHYQQSLTNGPVIAALVILIIVPELLGAFAYFTLVFRTQDRTTRYRITLVSWGLIGWFVLGLASGSVFGGGLLGHVLGQILGVLAAGVVLLAYYPPRYVRDRLGVAAVDPH